MSYQPKTFTEKWFPEYVKYRPRFYAVGFLGLTSVVARLI